MAALKYWVWLTALPGLSNRSRLLLLERYSSPEDVYYADAEELALTEGLTPGQAQLLSDKSLTRADRILGGLRPGRYFPADHAGCCLSRPAAGHFRPAGAAVRQGVAAAV